MQLWKSAGHPGWEATVLNSTVIPYSDTFHTSEQAEVKEEPLSAEVRPHQEAASKAASP